MNNNNDNARNPSELSPREVYHPNATTVITGNVTLGHNAEVSLSQGRTLSLQAYSDSITNYDHSLQNITDFLSDGNRMDMNIDVMGDNHPAD